jgi:hypothetical protein
LSIANEIASKVDDGFPVSDAASLSVLEALYFRLAKVTSCQAAADCFFDLLGSSESLVELFKHAKLGG